MDDGAGDRRQDQAVGVPLFRPEVLRARQTEWLGTASRAA
jgi:hypothetical protein